MHSIGPYQFVKYLSVGTSGRVFECRNMTTGEVVACKVVDRRELNDYGSLIHFEKELRILERIRHPNIVQIYEIIYFYT